MDEEWHDVYVDSNMNHGQGGKMMKKDKKWFVDKWTKERDKTDVHDPMYHFINEFISDVDQLDEPEVLTQEWIDEHSVAVAYDGMPDQTEIVYVDELEKLIVPKQELPVIPKYVADFIKVRKYTDAYSLQYIFCIAMERSEAEQLKKEYDWISANDETFARAWLDGYTVESEPLYYALVKGHELLDDSSKYWSHNKYDSEDFFISYNQRDDSPIIVKNTKSRWLELGINDSNADFVKLEENE